MLIVSLPSFRYLICPGISLSLVSLSITCRVAHRPHPTVRVQTRTHAHPPARSYTSTTVPSYALWPRFLVGAGGHPEFGLTVACAGARCWSSLLALAARCWNLAAGCSCSLAGSWSWVQASLLGAVLSFGPIFPLWPAPAIRFLVWLTLTLTAPPWPVDAAASAVPGPGPYSTSPCRPVVFLATSTLLSDALLLPTALSPLSISTTLRIGAHAHARCPRGHHPPVLSGIRAALGSWSRVSLSLFFGLHGYHTKAPFLLHCGPHPSPTELT